MESLTEDRVQWLRDEGYRYLEVSRERTRHFDPEAAVRFETASSHGVHLHKVLSEDGQEVRLYCFSEERAATSSSASARRRSPSSPKGYRNPYPETNRQGLATVSRGVAQHYAVDSTPTNPDNAPASLAARSAAR